MKSSSISCNTEVRNFHLFLQQWLRGDVPNLDSEFSRIVNTLADEFTLVAPGGTVENKSDLQQRLRQLYGSNNSISISIEDFRPIYESDDFMVIGYVEWRETNARRSGRHATACFRAKDSAPNGWIWTYVHETWVASNE